MHGETENSETNPLTYEDAMTEITNLHSSDGYELIGNMPGEETHVLSSRPSLWKPQDEFGGNTTRWLDVHAHTDRKTENDRW